MLKKIVAIVLSAFFFLIAATIVLSIFLNSAMQSKSELRPFAITSGENMQAVAKRLEQEGLIRSALFLQIIAKIRNTDGSFQVGSYAIPQNLNSFQVHDYLTSGKQVLEKVTIPEGHSSTRIAKLLEDKGIVKKQDFLKAVKNKALLESTELKGLALNSAEGFLFPDTYYFNLNSSAEFVVRHLVTAFFNELKTIVPEFDLQSNKQLYEKVVLASIIEREYRDPSEAALMASVFNNRLKINKSLESCATVVYVMTEEQGLKHPERLFFRDLKRSSKYNTYIHRGLPPGPISNPGTVALKAAFFPDRSDYLYFVLKSPTATQHQFSKTFADHNQATVLFNKQR